MTIVNYDTPSFQVGTIYVCPFSDFVNASPYIIQISLQSPDYQW